MASHRFLLALLGLGAFLGVAFGIVSFSQGNPAGGDIEKFEAEKLGSVRTVFTVCGREYEGGVSEGSTVYELIKFLQDSRDFSFRGKQFPGLGFFVEEINGLAQNSRERMYWIYYINGETASVGVSQYIIQPNDIIEWRYEQAN